MLITELQCYIFLKLFFLFNNNAEKILIRSFFILESLLQLSINEI